MNQILELTVFGANDCCLCADADQILTQIQPKLDDLGVRVTHVLIDGSPELEERYRTSIPIGTVDGQTLFKYHVDPDALVRMLDRRRQNLQSIR
jgi:hypothetical protein